jgi:hypothetical protein
MVLIPVYARLLIGDVSFDVSVVAESVVLYLGLPLVAGVLTRRAVVQRGGEAAMDRLKPGLSALSILGLLFTLIVMFALKGDLILERPQIVLEMAVPMAIFFLVMFGVVYLVSARLSFSYEDSVAVAFNSTGRDFEIAIAIAITAFSPTVALATVVGPLIEVPVMLALVWGAVRLRPRLFRRTTAGLAARAIGPASPPPRPMPFGTACRSVPPWPAGHRAGRRPGLPPPAPGRCNRAGRHRDMPRRPGGDPEPPAAPRAQRPHARGDRPCSAASGRGSAPPGSAAACRARPS